MQGIVTYISEALKLGNDKRNHNLEKQITDILYRIVWYKKDLYNIW